MSIRKIKLEDLVSVNSICINAFMGAVASTLTEEGIQTFRNIASVDGFANRMEADNEILAYEDSGEVVGVIEFKEGRHIAMLFVSPCFQKKGIGKSLISEIIPIARNNVLTVSASLTSVQAYINYGFRCVGEAGESAGLKYQPMEMKLNKEF